MFDAGAVEARLTLDKSDFTRNLAAAKAEAKDGISVPVKYDTGSLAGTFAQIRSAMQRAGLADILDIDLNPSQVSSQLALLKRRIQQAGITDLLDVNLNQSGLSDQLAKLRGETIPLKVVTDTSGLGDLSLPKVGETVDVAGLEQARAQMAALGVAADALSGDVARNSGLVEANEQWWGLLQGRLRDTQTGLTPLEASLRGAGTSVDDMNRSVTAGNIAWTAFTPPAQAAAAALGSIGHAADAAAGSGGRMNTGFGFLTMEVPLWGGLAHGVGLWHIALDGALETLIATGLAATTMSITLYAMVPAAEDIYTHLTAVSDVNSALGASIPPLAGKFQALQQSMAPNVLELYGGALNLVSKSAGTLGTTVHATGNLMDDWIAKIDLWMAAQNSTGKLLQSGTGYLRQFGEIFASVGLAISNLVKSDPGTAHFLGDVIVGAAKLLDIITELPTPILFAALALHSIYLWGGLAVTALTKLGGVFGLDTLATKLGMVSTETKVAADGAETLEKSFLGLSGGNWLFIAAGAAALGYFTYQAFQADSATKAFIGSLNTGLDGLSASQAIPQVTTDIGVLNQKIAEVPVHVAAMNEAVKQGGASFFDLVGEEFRARSAGDALATSWKIATNVFHSFGGELADTSAQLHQTSDIAAYKGAIVSLTGEQKNLFAETGALMRGTTTVTTTFKANADALVHVYGGVSESVKTATTGALTYSQAMALMDLAGVQASDSLALMKQKVDNLITGYKDMSVQGGLLAAGVNAVTFAADLQSSKITDLTKAYTSFTGVVTGGESTMITFDQGLATTAVNAKVAGASYSGLNAASLTLRSSFEGNVTAATAMYNALSTQAAAAGLGAQGTNLLTRAGKDLVATQLAGAKGSAANTAQLYALAQIAGYTGADSFKALSKWVGNTTGAEKDLNKITGTLTVSSADLATDVSNLASAISQNLNQAMSAAIFQASGGQKVFDAFATSAQNAHGHLGEMRGSAQSLASELITTTGNTTQAHSEFDAFAIQLGLTKKQADSLWASLDHVRASEGAIPATKTVGLLMEAHGEYNVSQVKYFDTAHSFFNLAAGGKITQGTGPTSDDVLARVSKGETVVSAQHSQVLAPAFSAIGVPGYAAGGIVGNLGPAFVSGTYASFRQFAEAAAAGALGPALQTATNAAALAAQQAAFAVGPASGGGWTHWSPGAGVNQWRTDTVQALSQLGLSSGLVLDVLYQMMTESGGNPNAVNRSDSNWAAGHPSVGLMQVISGTFDAYAGPYRNTGPFSYGVSVDPMANIYAALNYASHNRGFGQGPGQVGSGHGYDSGGYLMPGATLAVNNTGRPEMVVPPQGLDDIADGLAVLASQLDSVIAALHAAPARTGAALGSTLAGVARAGVNAGLYS